MQAMNDDRPARVRRTESSPGIRGRARELRREDNPAEDRLWQALRDRKLRGLKFRRQRPIGQFIADFYCVEARLVIEIDGQMHATLEASEHDAERDRWMKERGIHVVRIPANVVLTNVGQALTEIERHLEGIGVPLTPGPSPAGGRGVPSASEAG